MLQLVIIAIVVALLALLAIFSVFRKQKEGFSIGSIFNGVKNAFGTAANAVGNAVKGVIGKVTGKQVIDTYQVTYRGRQWDGGDWTCPDWTVETGSKEDYNACITSTHHNPVWKPVNGTWGWNCPNGTVPTNESKWERKCEAGWMHRVLSNGQWVCPSGTTDSGRNWNNSTWSEAQKQCRRSIPYTLRIAKDGRWVCPDGSVDTGRGWGDAFPYNQCKWTGP